MRRLCRVDRVIEGLPLKVMVPGLPPLAVFRRGDTFHVVDALCTHGWAWLTEGHQSGWQVQCPLHGGAFDIRDGAVLAPPYTVPLKTYPARVESGFVNLVDVNL